MDLLHISWELHLMWKEPMLNSTIVAGSGMTTTPLSLT
jgi:hypothetical protein